MHITAWWGWLILAAGSGLIVFLIWCVCWVINALMHMFDGW
jgi:hypothetical protein